MMDGPAAAEVFLFEGFRFDRAESCLFRENGSHSGEPLPLGSRAAALLALLVERPGKLVTKDEIFAAVWPGTAVEEANLTVQIWALRRIQIRQSHPCHRATRRSHDRQACLGGALRPRPRDIFAVQDDITEAATDRNCPGRRHSR